MNNWIDDPSAFLKDLFRVAVDTADPMLRIPLFLPQLIKPSCKRLLIIGAGKASARMAEATELYLNAQGIDYQGLVITRYGYGRTCQKIEILEAAHPIPDQNGENASLRMLDFVKGLGPDDQVIALISGGGSALLNAPKAGISLEDLQTLNQIMLESGAPISIINQLRKHLCRLKGGGLAAACAPAWVSSLIISDVPKDDLSLIASGPTVACDYSPDQALEILAAYYPDAPIRIKEAIKSAPHPIMPNDPRMEKVENILIATAAQSLIAAKDYAKATIPTMLEVTILGDDLEGEAADLGRTHAKLALEIQQNRKPNQPAQLLLSGGEATVTLHKDSPHYKKQALGGPNAEYLLSMAIALKGSKGIYALACDTDGVDGTAEIAGAIISPYTIPLAIQKATSLENALLSHDSHHFFERLGNQIICGPTLTNVNDFRAILIT